MKNKVLALFLSLVMSLALLPAVAFAAQSYKITFHVEGNGYVYARGIASNLNDGSFVMVEEGQDVVLYAMANSKEYKMKTATAEGATLSWGGSATRTLKMPGNNVDVYFTFGPANYKTVYFDANGGTGIMSPVEDADDSYVLPECTFGAPEGKEFAGWSKSPEGPAFTNQVMGLTSDPTTLYAIWKDKTPTHAVNIEVRGKGSVTIRINGDPAGSYRNGGSFEAAEGAQVVAYAVPDTEDYEYRQMHIYGAESQWAGSVSRVFTMSDRDVTLLVYFNDRSKFVVTFDANSGKGTMAPEVDVTSPYVLPARPLFTAPAGKEFDGWSRTPNGPVITTNTISLNEDTTLYAIWKDRTYWLEEYAPGVYMICKRGSYEGNNVPQYAIPVNNRPSSMRVSMYYVPDYDAWCLLSTERCVLSSRYFFEKDMGSPEAKLGQMVPKPNFASYGLVGDVNSNGALNVVDAQVAYDMATGVHTSVGSSSGSLGSRGWLMADINGDRHVDAADALAIQSRVVRGAGE